MVCNESAHAILSGSESLLRHHLDKLVVVDLVVTVKVGFPELSCGGDSPCPEDHPYSFHDLQTTVRGTSITHTVGALAEHVDKKMWFDKLDRIHLFEVTFKPKETLEIRHTYRHKLSEYVEGYEAHYVTRTGVLWAGPIGKARLTIKTPWPHHYVAFPENFELVGRTETLAKKTLPGGLKTTWTHVFEMTDWTPKEDLYILFGNYMERGPQQCAAVDEVSWSRQKLEKTLKSETPDKKELAARVDEEIRREHFEKLSDEELRQCRNYPYALHGYSFKDEKLHAYFYAPAFSTHCAFCGETPPDEFMDEDNPMRYTRFFFKPNIAYTPKLLTTDDLAYVRIAKAEQARRRKLETVRKK